MKSRTVSFPGGKVVVAVRAEETVVRVFGIADRVSTPGQAGDGPVIVEIRKPKKRNAGR